MAHNSYVRAGAVWNNGSAVTSAEFNLFDVAQFKSINGDDGGTWSPAAIIILGGAGLNVTGPATIGNIVSATVPASGLITVQSGGIIQVNASGSVVVNGTLTLSTTGALAALSGSSSVWNSGAVFNCTANATFNGTLTLTTTGNVLLGSSSVTRVQEGTPWASTSNWIPDAAIPGGANNVTTGTKIYLPLDLPSGATLTSVTVYATGAAGHAGLPAVMPMYSVLEGATDGTTISYGGVVDPSATTAAFQVNHATTLAVSAATNRATKRYFIEYSAESGANALAGLKITSWTATYTVTQYDRGVG